MQRRKLNFQTQAFFICFIISMLLKFTYEEKKSVEFSFNKFFLHKCQLLNNNRSRRSLFPTDTPLHCPPCEQIHCPQQKFHCKGRKTLGICGCCKVCAKTEGERCGGQHDFLGKCESGLFCEPQKPTLITHEKDGIQRFYRVDTGLCKKKKQQKKLISCKPECSPEFCNKNPRGICSAKVSYDQFQECQGFCQHTSCRACQFILSDTKCPNCTTNDFKCIRDFGRCIRKKTCSKIHQYPCKKSKLKENYKGIFQCQVPPCDFIKSKSSN